MLANAKIGAVIPVTDLARSREFYENVLGLSVLREDLDRASVSYQSAGAYLQIYQRATASSGEHTVAGFMIQGDFDTIADGLIQRGVTFDTFEIPGVEIPWDSRGIAVDGEDRAGWFKDPDGNVLTIVTDSAM